ncbi:MAG: FAD-dependent thymidylate synthase [Chitinispirillia bacterium]|nr:FAD-dependent thymidylate synthase [Chitinispirillia bacterium]
MKITAIAITPPPGASVCPKVTPELLASSLARYSRSNKGLDSILGSIDWSDPDKSVDSIFRFVDYGHASITGMTGGIAIAIDGLSMFLAYRIFEIAQLCDGQESSTRYIKLDKTTLPSANEAGIPKACAQEWEKFMEKAFSVYHEVYNDLDEKVKRNPELLKLPENVNEKVRERLSKNYALDRARYFIPFATKTNAAYVMTARVWAETLRQLDSIPLPEAKKCAAHIRVELDKFVPRMTRHSFSNESSKSQTEQLFAYSINAIKNSGVNTANIADEVYLEVMNDTPSFLPNLQSVSETFSGKENRYSLCGTTARRIMVKTAWNNMAIAELRDLNRHRSGYRFSPLSPVGFYLPSEVKHPLINELMSDYKNLVEKIAAQEQGAHAYVYAMLLGTQVAFEHGSHLDKFIYEIELRTGMGAHFRYADHLAKAAAILTKKMPQLAPYIQTGNAEPEF